METNRRNWLKQIGTVVAGLGIAPLSDFATPLKQYADLTAGSPMIRLIANENPYGPSPMARKAMVEHIALSNRYGAELTGTLIAAIAKKNKVAPENILPAAGSTEILDIVARYAGLSKGSFVLAEPTFNYWADTAQRSGFKKIAVPLTADRKHDLPAMLQAIQPDTSLIYVCNPNNPTGTICDNAALEAFVKEASKKAIVLVDEAYIDFTEQRSLSSLVIENKNLVIAKTFSKIYGLAGARIGYAIANAAMLEQISRLQSWPGGAISVASTAGALAALKDESFVKEVYALNNKTKKYTIEQLERLNIPCIPSFSNFIYFSLANYKKDFFEQLKNSNILGTRIYEEQGKWTRITVGTMQEMEKFIKAIA